MDMRLGSSTKNDVPPAVLSDRANRIQYLHRVSRGFNIVNSHNVRAFHYGGDN